jgi:HK97 family phage prohead protease
MAIEELSQGEFLTKAIAMPKIWRNTINVDGIDKPIIEFEAWVSTEAIDRDGEIIRVAGWRKPSLGKAKLLLFHDYDELAIGKPYWTRPKTEGDIVGLYTRGRLGPQIEGLAVGELYLLGDMDAFSVGFHWFKRIFDSEADGIKKPFYEFIDQELYEYSAVNVPCNPEATIAMENMLADAGDIKDVMAIIKSFNKQPKQQTIKRDSYIVKEMDRKELSDFIKSVIKEQKDKEISASDIDAFIDDDNIEIDLEELLEVEVDALDAEGDTLEVLVSVGDVQVDVEPEINVEI